jgi:gamma-glutamyl:cysteine ligase YbdK (ATP-grasp superfamily)
MSQKVLNEMIRPYPALGCCENEIMEAAIAIISLCSHTSLLSAISNDMDADIQEYHLPVYHTICRIIENRFF